ncbi:hypothetical protein HYC85_003077 [Camellia sinensis]|uniref:Clp R domain-containing protein n=1 Tax=Camellia sinensis TaxID=4442 RepID=A0A7J7ICD4_CAMSI|nr:hypothetical protein HYC85_003077 [Camellia sinensis]
MVEETNAKERGCRVVAEKSDSCSPVFDYSFLNREAALIVSKRMLAEYYVKSSSEKEDSRKVLTLEPYENETHFGKSNVRQTLELEGSGLATRKYKMPCGLGQSKKNSTPRLELIKDKDYNTVGESVFKSIVKFVLSVFDMEDFERIFDQSVVEDEYSKLCEILDSCKCDPLVAIAEGKVKVDQFSTLREHDLCDTIRQHKCSAERKVKADQFSKLREHDIYDDRTEGVVLISGGVSLDFDVVGGWGQKGEIEVGAVEGSDAKGEMVLRPWVFPIFGPEWNDISPNEVAIALEMLRNYEPLKRLWGGDDIELLPDGLFIGLYELAAMKTSALLYFQEAVIFPLSDGCFGPFTDEFIEVIKIADHERRMQGDRFISVKHLLFGLSLSSVRRCVVMMLHGRVLDYTGQLALKLSSFSIYKLSRDAATFLGDKNVGLEHLVLAIFYGKQENDRTRTAAQDDCSSLFFDEKKWDDYLLKHEKYHEEGEIKEVQSNRRLKYKAVMEENTLINSSSSLVSGSEGESNTLAPDKSTLESENWGGVTLTRIRLNLKLGDFITVLIATMTAFGMKRRRPILFGMDAALIVSKRMLANYYVKSSSEKEDSRKVLTREPYETHFGKSNVRQTLELEGSGLATRKYKMPRGLGQSKKNNTPRLELIKDKDYNTVGESVFKSVVKFVLSVFDMKDFERIFDQSVVEDEYSKLCEILDSCKCDPLVAIAEGKVKVDQFSTLREHDICDTIRQHKCSAERKVQVDQFSKLREHDIYDDRTEGVVLIFCVREDGLIFLFDCCIEKCKINERKKEKKIIKSSRKFFVHGFFLFLWNDISPNEVAIALEMLRNYEPLKEDCKMQLTLELTNEKSYCILDSLVLEALGGVDIELLRNCLTNTADDVFLAEDVTFACSVLADGLFIGLYELAAMKTLALLYFQEAVIFPLSDGCFGPFTDEFIEVIKIADHERRMQGDRFISVKHLLFGLSLSSVRRCVEMMLHGRVLDYTGQLALKLSSFSIYKLSHDAATILGDKNVGLEHLVLEIFHGKQENDRTGTAAQDDCSSLFFDEKKWDDYLLKHYKARVIELAASPFRWLSRLRLHGLMILGLCQTNRALLPVSLDLHAKNFLCFSQILHFKLPC